MTTKNQNKTEKKKQRNKQNLVTLHLMARKQERAGTILCPSRQFLRALQISHELPPIKTSISKYLHTGVKFLIFVFIQHLDYSIICIYRGIDNSLGLVWN